MRGCRAVAVKGLPLGSVWAAGLLPLRAFPGWCLGCRVVAVKGFPPGSVWAVGLLPLRAFPRGVSGLPGCCR